MQNQEWRQGDFFISTDPNLLDISAVHRFLSSSYWAERIPRSFVAKSIQNSLCFGMYKSSEQIGFARVVSDFSTFAYLADVYVEPAWRGRGLSKWLVQCLLSHPELQNLRRFCLATRDAHGLYQKFGFEVIKQPQNWMEIKKSDLYKQLSTL